MKYPPNIYERDALIEVSLKVIPCMKCSRLFKKGGNSMSSMRCDRCHSSLRQRWQVQRVVDQRLRV
jgi:uncharacterized paraquat-inducible protein A